jgi:hypothetical protein
VGEKLRVHGQGLVARQLRGPLTAQGEPALETFWARKYECQRCGAVMTVVPSEALPGRLYSAPAIALSLWLFVVEALTGASVRDRVSPWRTRLGSRRRGWAQLYRWVRDVRTLFRLSRPLAEADPRTVVRRTLVSLLAMAKVGLVGSPEVAQVFAGAGSFR